MIRDSCRLSLSHAATSKSGISLLGAFLVVLQLMDIMLTPPFLFDFEISGRRSCVRREVSGSVQLPGFTVAILAQGTNRGDALCAALLLNRAGTILA